MTLGVPQEIPCVMWPPLRQSGTGGRPSARRGGGTASDGPGIDSKIDSHFFTEIFPLNGDLMVFNCLMGIYMVFNMSEIFEELRFLMIFGSWFEHPKVIPKR